MINKVILSHKFDSYLLAFITFLLSCSFSTAQTSREGDKNRTEYYSMIPLRESPYPVFQGIIRLSEEEAMTRNHYRFQYDSQFRLESVSFWLGDRLRNPNHTANYFFTSPMLKIEYSHNQEVITYYDRHGNQTTQRGAYRSVYSLDEKGRRTSLHYEDAEGNPVVNGWDISNYTWEHQNDGSVIEGRYNAEGTLMSLRPHFEFHRIRLYYDQNGFLALMQNIDETGELLENSTGVAQDKLLFDSQGRWMGWNVLDANHELHRGNGPNVAKGINIPDAYGYETSIRYEDVDGTALINSHGFWGSKRYYDKYGNYSYTQFIDSLGNPGINEQSGYCYAFYTWDDVGYNRLKIELMDVKKQPVLHKRGGYATIQYTYDSTDNLVKVNYLGADGEMINRADNGTSYIEYTYDENHARLESKRFDKSGKLLD